jgi:hypothetical protein
MRCRSPDCALSDGRNCMPWQAERESQAAAAATRRSSNRIGACACCVRRREGLPPPGAHGGPHSFFVGHIFRHLQDPEPSPPPAMPRFCWNTAAWRGSLATCLACWRPLRANMLPADLCAAATGPERAQPKLRQGTRAMGGDLRPRRIGCIRLTSTKYCQLNTGTCPSVLTFNPEALPLSKGSFRGRLSAKPPV